MKSIKEVVQGWFGNHSCRGTTSRESCAFRNLVVAIGAGVAMALIWIGLVAVPQALAQGDTWETKAPKPIAVVGPAAGAIGGKLYVVGGATGSCPSSAASEVYDPATNIWTSIAPLPEPRHSGAAEVIDGKLYVAGGTSSSCVDPAQATLYMYDPETDTWTRKADMSASRVGLALGVIDGKLYALGSGHFGGPNFEMYDPATDTWTAKASFPTVVTGPAVGVLDGKLYVAGGFAGGCPPCTSLATLWVYDPATDAWTSKASLPSGRNQPAGGVINGIFYVAGGIDTVAGSTNTLFAYDPATDSWTTKASMSVARTTHAAATIDGQLYVVGGNGRVGPISSLEVYTPTVVNQSPTADAGPNQVVESASPSGTSVTLNGTGSGDPDGDTLTFEWKDASNNVIGTTATVNVTAPLGTTTYTLTVTDPGGLSSTATTDVSVQDTISPAIQCGTADGLWHANNVSINCTATDGGSGPASQNVALTTSVAANTEDANASTDSQQVCDAVGNCATAGPVSGNMIDRKAPSISITAPTASTYLLNQSAASGYSCTDGGSGTATCAGPVASGSNFDTASAGAKSFTVTATDVIGNSTSSAVNYSVGYAAAGMCFGSAGHAILQPVNADGTSVFKKGSTVPAKFRVCDANGNSIGSPGVVSSFRLIQTIAGTVSDVDEAVYSTTPDAAFRWDANAMQWIFNINTKTLAVGTTYVYRITLNDGSTIDFQFGLK